MQSFSFSDIVSDSCMFFSYFEHMSDADFHVIADQTEFSHNQAQQLFENALLKSVNNAQNFLIKFVIVVDMHDKKFILDDIKSLQNYLNILQS